MTPSEASSAATQPDRKTQTITQESLRLDVNNADISTSTFANVDLSLARFTDVRLAGAVLNDVDLSGAQLVDINLTGVTIEDAELVGLTINGCSIEWFHGFGARFESVSPIGHTDPKSLPVKDVGAAVAYYVNVLGFTCVASTASVATLQRDAVEIGLTANGADPDQASVYFGVNDVEALHRELTAKSASPSALREDVYGDRRHLICFAKEPYGVCFCFGQRLTASDT